MKSSCRGMLTVYLVLLSSFASPDLLCSGSDTSIPSIVSSSGGPVMVMSNFKSHDMVWSSPGEV